MLTAVPYLDQFFGVWAMPPAELQALHHLCVGLDLQVHLNSPQASAARNVAGGGAAPVKDRIATVQLAGTLMKQQASFGNTTSTVLARRQLRAAADDDAVDGVLLHVESPGGTAAGTMELAADVAATAKKKPLYAFVEDIGASAAYWPATQATKIYANAAALVGAIGTYGVVLDQSGAAEKAGVKVHVIKAGEFKGMGQPGTKITDEQIAELQRTIDSINAFFLQGVADGRRLPLARVKELADGRVHRAADAKALGLIDGVQTFEATLKQLASASRRPPAAPPPPARSFAASPASAASSAPRMSKAERRQQLNRGWAAAVKMELAAGFDPISASSRARRKHPELWRQFMLANGQRVA